MTGQPLRIAVIGAGIGGLTAALSLRRAGFEVDIYEQAPALTHIGGGINMGPNAARILIRLGLGEGLLRDGVCPSSTHQRRWDDGRTLQRSPLNPQCEQLYGAPQCDDPSRRFAGGDFRGVAGRAHPSRLSPHRLCR
jgi:salicylate hydroxylase